MSGFRVSVKSTPNNCRKLFWGVRHKPEKKRNGSSARLGVRGRVENGVQVRVRVPVSTRAQAYVRTRIRVRLRVQVRVRVRGRARVGARISFFIDSSSRVPAKRQENDREPRKKNVPELNFNINLVRKLPLRDPKFVSK